MTPNRTRPTLTVLFVGGLLWIAACGSQPNENRIGTSQPQATADGEAQLRALEAKLQAQSPVTGNPTQLESGKPFPVTATRGDEPKQADNCPVDAFTIVRAEAGKTCDDYQAEISAWDARCVGDCDRRKVDVLLVNAAGARCVEFCQKKGCSRASFIPPPNGAARYECFNDPKRCPKAECPTREYGSLIDARRVWNCVCRDIIPT